MENGKCGDPDAGAVHASLIDSIDQQSTPPHGGSPIDGVRLTTSGQKLSSGDRGLFYDLDDTPPWPVIMLYTIQVLVTTRRVVVDAYAT